ncbi:hypothetical protein Tco_1213356 [Tanacetum coccineum]
MPKPAPAKPHEKKRKPVSESSEAPPLAKRAKAGKWLRRELRPILQKVLEESLTDAYPTRMGPLPLVVFREPDTGKLQPLPEVPGKGKEKVGEEQAAQVLLHLQTPKKKSPTEQYIFQRRSHVPTEIAGREDSTALLSRIAKLFIDPCGGGVRGGDGFGVMWGVNEVERDRLNTAAGNPVKKILLKLNLSDHRSILTDSKKYLKMVMEVPDSSRLTDSQSANAHTYGKYKDIMKAQVHVSRLPLL